LQNSAKAFLLSRAKASSLVSKELSGQFLTTKQVLHQKLFQSISEFSRVICVLTMLKSKNERLQKTSSTRAWHRQSLPKIKLYHSSRTQTRYGASKTLAMLASTGGSSPKFCCAQI